MRECYEVSRFGSGGFPYEQVLRMPIPHRRYIHSTLIKEQEDRQKQENGQVLDGSAPNIPEFVSDMHVKRAATGKR